MSKYSKLSLTTISLHWLVAILMVGSTIVGLIITEMARTAARHELMDFHKSIGVLVLTFAIIKIFWRYNEGHYETLGRLPKYHAKGVSLIHWLLLLSTVLMPISGMMMSIGGGYPINIFGFAIISAGDKNELMGQTGHIVHSGGMYLLVGCFLLHLLGVLKYQFINKHPVVSRMLGKRVEIK